MAEKLYMINLEEMSNEWLLEQWCQIEESIGLAPFEQCQGQIQNILIKRGVLKEYER